MEFKRFKRDPTKVQTDKVVDWEVRDTLSQKGNKTIRINWVTEYRKFSTWYQPDAERGRMFADCDQIKRVTNEWQTMPETITYQKNAENGFYRIHTFNEEADEVAQVA
jgi:DNA repair protein RadD